MASMADIAADAEAQERFHKTLVPVLLQMLGGTADISVIEFGFWRTHPRYEILRTDLPNGMMRLELRDLTDVQATLDTHRGRLELTRDDIDLLHELKAGRLTVTKKET